MCIYICYHTKNTLPEHFVSIFSKSNVNSHMIWHTVLQKEVNSFPIIQQTETIYFPANTFKSFLFFCSRFYVSHLSTKVIFHSFWKATCNTLIIVSIIVHMGSCTHTIFCSLVLTFSLIHSHPHVILPIRKQIPLERISFLVNLPSRNEYTQITL